MKNDDYNSSEEPKAKVTITVEYNGETWEEEGECAANYFYDDLGDIVAGIDYDVRQSYIKRQELKEALRK